MESPYTKSFERDSISVCYAEIWSGVIIACPLIIKIWDSWLQNGIFIYKSGFSVTEYHLSFTKRESPLTNGILKLHFIWLYNRIHQSSFVINTLSL